ncbi:MAG: hypothetical protein E6J72_01990 [Deltaproteobacteria bacterium]|nr:MAG: hypothetical protein E6J72_01990 [Deltaproteobacteria bacterium]
MSDGEDEEQQQLEDAEEDDAADTASPLTDGAVSDDGAAAEEPKFAALLEKLHAEHNFDFREYKPASLLRRIRRRMTQVHVERFESYMSYLDKHADEHIALLNAILINVTRFFRDPEAWDMLRDHVLPSIIDAARAHARPAGGVRRQDIRHRHRRRRARGGALRALPPRSRERRTGGARRPVLHARRPGVPGPPRHPEMVHLRPSRPDARCAAVARRSARLPERPHLLRQHPAGSRGAAVPVRDSS